MVTIVKGYLVILCVYVTINGRTDSQKPEFGPTIQSPAPKDSGTQGARSTIARAQREWDPGRSLENSGDRGDKGEKPISKGMSLVILITDVLSINHQTLNVRGPMALHNPTEWVT